MPGTIYEQPHPQPDPEEPSQQLQDVRFYAKLKRNKPENIYTADHAGGFAR